MTKFGDTLTTREALIAATLDTLEVKANEASQTIEGGALDGISVVSIDTLRGLTLDVRSMPLPPPSDRYAEVTTPAEIKVSMPCPECGVPVTSTLFVHPQLIVEGNVRKIKAKAKAEPVVHMHGQLPLAEGDEAQVTIEETIDDLRLRILRAVAWVGAAHVEPAPGEDPGPPPTVDAIATYLELATEGDRGDLEDALYGYAEGGFVEVLRAKGAPIEYALTEAGAELIDVDGDPEEVTEDDPDDDEAVK